MHPSTYRSHSMKRNKIPLFLFGLGLLIFSALLIQQVLAQSTPATLKPPFHLNRSGLLAPNSIVPNPALTGPIVVSQTFGSSYSPTSNLSAVGWHQPMATPGAA
jgi:hypothetical protein